MKTSLKMALMALAAALFVASPTLVQAAQPQQQQWTFETEALFLHRNQTKGVPVAITTGTARTVLGTNDIKFGFRPGVRFTLGYHPDPNNTVELVYFGLQKWTAKASTNCDKLGESSPCLAAVFSQASPSSSSGFYDFEDFGAINNPAEAARIKYQSKLHNVELNYKRHFAPWGNFIPTLLVGLRYMSVPERFGIAMFGEDGDLSDRADYKIKSKNHLFGVQVGGDGTYRMGSVDLSLRAKAGLFANWAKQITSGSETSEGFSDSFRGSKSEAGAAGVGEAGLFATWNLHPNVALTAGYQILYIAGLALAPEQMATSNSQGAISQLDKSGSAFYHGPSVGVKVSW